MRDEELNRLHIELAIAKARHERAQALANLLRCAATTIRSAWIAMWLRWKITGELR